MDIKVQLNFNNGFQWTKQQDTAVKGYAFDNKGILYRNEGLIQFFSAVDNVNEFLEKLNNANGFFSIILEKKEKIFVAVDRLRSIPLFYSISNECFYLTDDSYWLKEKLNLKEFDKLSKNEFLLTGYVTGKDTLFAEIKQLQAGEFLVFDKKKNKLQVYTYFEFRHNEVEKDEKELIEEMDQMHIRVMRRLIKSLNGKTAVIPLSGGYDSRLIAVMLKRLGYEKVICFTYGKPRNWEAKISQQMASYLGYKWIFIPYTRKKWYLWYHSEENKEYIKFNGSISSLAHIQDFPAVWEMKKQRLIPDDSIFIPGHAGDFVAGSHIPTWFIEKKYLTQEELLQSILNKHYSLWNWRKQEYILRPLFSKKMKKIIGAKEKYNIEVAADLFECWDWRERQTKFIANSIRVYEFWGYEWRLPLWDNEMMEYWSKVKLNYRIKRNLYFIYVKKTQDIFLKYETDKKNIRYLLNKKIKAKYVRKVLAMLMKLKDYYTHPMQWYVMTNLIKYFISILNNDINVNSFLVKDNIRNSKCKNLQKN